MNRGSNQETTLHEHDYFFSIYERKKNKTDIYFNGPINGLEKVYKNQMVKWNN